MIKSFQIQAQSFHLNICQTQHKALNEKYEQNSQ